MWVLLVLLILLLIYIWWCCYTEASSRGVVGYSLWRRLLTLMSWERSAVYVIITMPYLHIRFLKRTIFCFIICLHRSHSRIWSTMILLCQTRKWSPCHARFRQSRLEQRSQGFNFSFVLVCSLLGIDDLIIGVVIFSDELIVSGCRRSCQSAIYY